MDPWLLACEGFDPEEELLREALCTPGNGYCATRGPSGAGRRERLPLSLDVPDRGI